MQDGELCRSNVEGVYFSWRVFEEKRRKYLRVRRIREKGLINPITLAFIHQTYIQPFLYSGVVSTIVL